MEKYRWRDIRWRDFSLVPIIIVTFIGTIIYIVFTKAIFEEALLIENFTLIGIDEINVLTQLFTYILVITAFLCLNIDLFKTWMRQWWNGLKCYWLWIICAYIVTFEVAWAYGWVKDLFPNIYTTETTQNEQVINQLLSIPELTLYNFLLIVFAGPIVEEIFFRHILIGELGKKLNFIVMSIVSIVLFSAMHLIEISNWIEIIDYLIIAIPLVFLYIKSGRNLGVAISFHILNNFIAYCINMLN
ncbi:CPBP family intramembrane metalloprotease [Staphylococcus sp. 11007852]|uniref:CPBP family intramembrane glutamic endopeptidase n=1 Tax=Staphylococcus TaxID=1279 RepID=UPI001402E79D|nr:MULTISPECIES: type II CAAX endopeptidase family protein [Staphylococcus]NHM74818.1 CPBP family intramembrane metalloprotease [Staphylococcus sp. 11007852]NJH82818.1 CPBP family intramembrane metalloprotease [Staphylococcus agnetis]